MRLDEINFIDPTAGNIYSSSGVDGMQAGSHECKPINEQHTHKQQVRTIKNQVITCPPQSGECSCSGVQASSRAPQRTTNKHDGSWRWSGDITFLLTHPQDVTVCVCVCVFRLYLRYNHWLPRVILYFFILVDLSLALFEDPAVIPLPTWVRLAAAAWHAVSSAANNANANADC